MKQSLFIVACLLVFAVSRAEIYSLEQCIDLAMENNIAIQQQRNQDKTQSINFSQQKQNLMPTVNGSVSQNWSFGRATGVDNITRSQNMSNTNIGLSANLLLFDGLGMKYRIDQARAEMQSSQAQTEKLEADLKMNIVAMYLQVLLKKELLALADSQLLTTRLKIEQQQQLIAEGRLAEGEIYALQAQHAKEEYSRTQADSDTKLALLDLAQAMNVEFSDAFDVLVPQDIDDWSSLLPSNDDVYEAAIKNRPEIKSAEASLKSLEYSLKEAKSAYSPTLSAGASIGTGYYHLYGNENNSFGEQLNDNFQTNVGLSLNIPLFDKMQTPNTVKRQKISVLNQKLQIEQVKQTLKKEIDQAYYNALAAQAEQLSAQKAEQSALEAYRYAEQKYEAGRASVYEYYDAKNNFRQAQSQYLQAQYNYIFKLRILQYYSGDM